LRRYRFPDPADSPSPLFDQLVWPRDAGYEGTDCFWMRAGHAIYGGFKGAPATRRDRRLGFAEALAAAQAVGDAR